ncbi:ABC-2 transporter permease [Ileibacterium valens]|uniref:ABC-2 transporter permease n=1 Tax=Ileibacterium valens TaxID=1862668 RepID=UPI00257253C3|nr:ABC-2 transporter permease [Ileibacterium valens]
MTGIYKKDLIQIRMLWPILLSVSVIVCAALFYADAPIGLISYFPIFLAFQATSTIFADKASGWTRMSVTFPFTRPQLIRSKYFLTLALGTTGFIIGLAMYWIYTLLNGNVQGNTAETFQVNFCIACLILFSSTAIVIPLSYAMKKNQEFIVVIASLLPSVLVLYYWSTTMVTNTISVDQSISYVEVNMNTPLLSAFAAGSFILFLASMIIMPLVLSRQDLR